MSLTITSATWIDADFLFELRNEAAVRKMSKNQALVMYADHMHWLTKLFESGKSKIWILLENGKKSGQFRVDENGMVSIALAPESRGKGNMSPFLKLGASEAFSSMPLEKLVAHVRKENQASLKGFLRSGYHIEREIQIEGHDYFELVLGR